MKTRSRKTRTRKAKADERSERFPPQEQAPGGVPADLRRSAAAILSEQADERAPEKTAPVFIP